MEVDAVEPEVAAAAVAAGDDAQAISPAIPTPTLDAGGGAGIEAPINPRKRKKASRACDYCHLNHQPCDNGKPRCGVCEKHNKTCSYLRPTKRRGPQKGYRTALNTYKESAAAWGVVLGAIPGLDALIEGHLRSENGRYLLSSVKDPAQQDALIQKWQQSTVFKTFFPSTGSVGSVEGEDAEPSGGGVGGDALDIDDSSFPLPRGKQNTNKLAASAGRITTATTTRSSFGPMDISPRKPPATSLDFPVIRDPTALSDIVAKDAARSSSHASQTLAPLGFAPDETIADFYDIGSNPEQISQFTDAEHDMGTDAEQRVYYELLMGRSFDYPGRPT